MITRIYGWKDASDFRRDLQLRRVIKQSSGRRNRPGNCVHWQAWTTVDSSKLGAYAIKTIRIQQLMCNTFIDDLALLLPLWFQRFSDDFLVSEWLNLYVHRLELYLILFFFKLHSDDWFLIWIYFHLQLCK